MKTGLSKLNVESLNCDFFDKLDSKFFKAEENQTMCKRKKKPKTIDTVKKQSTSVVSFFFSFRYAGPSYHIYLPCLSINKLGNSISLKSNPDLKGLLN